MPQRSQLQRYYDEHPPSAWVEGLEHVLTAVQSGATLAGLLMLAYSAFVVSTFRPPGGLIPPAAAAEPATAAVWALGPGVDAGSALLSRQQSSVAVGAGSLGGSAIDGAARTMPGRHRAILAGGGVAAAGSALAGRAARVTVAAGHGSHRGDGNDDDDGVATGAVASTAAAPEAATVAKPQVEGDPVPWTVYVFGALGLASAAAGLTHILGARLRSPLALNFGIAAACLLLAGQVCLAVAAEAANGGAGVPPPLPPPGSPSSAAQAVRHHPGVLIIGWLILAGFQVGGAGWCWVSGWVVCGHARWGRAHTALRQVRGERKKAADGSPHAPLDRFGPREGLQAAPC